MAGFRSRRRNKSAAMYPMLSVAVNRNEIFAKLVRAEKIAKTISATINLRPLSSKQSKAQENMPTSTSRSARYDIFAAAQVKLPRNRHLHSRFKRHAAKQQPASAATDSTSWLSNCSVPECCE